MFQCVLICTVLKGRCTWAQPHEVSRSCGLPVFSPIVLTVGAAGDGHWRRSRCQGELWCAFTTPHTTSLFLHLCSYVTFSFFLLQKKCGTRKIYLGANGWRLLRKHGSRLRVLWMKGLWEDNYCHVWTCTYFSSTIAIIINPLKTKHRPLYLKTQSVPRCKHFSSRL